MKIKLILRNWKNMLNNILISNVCGFVCMKIHLKSTYNQYFL